MLRNHGNINTGAVVAALFLSLSPLVLSDPSCGLGLRGRSVTMRRNTVLRLFTCLLAAGTVSQAAPVDEAHTSSFSFWPECKCVGSTKSAILKQNWQKANG